MKPSAFLGLRTVVYFVADLARAKAWYQEMLGIAPYFDEPFYVGFNVGGFELGLHPGGASDAPRGSATAYWGVPSMKGSWERLIALGATPVDAPEDVGGGILIGSVKDPFGNVVGLIENPTFPNQA